MDALNRRQRYAKGGRARGKQPSTDISLHHGDSHALLLAELIELRAVRVDTAQPFLVIFRRKILVHILAGREQIKRRVDAEQNHLNLTAQGSQNSHLWVVGAQANVTDNIARLLIH